MSIQQASTLDSKHSLSLMKRIDWRRFSMRLGTALMAMAIGFGAVYWAAVLMLGPDQKARYTWSADVQFLFSGVSQGQYPNGMPFSASDLISETILARALATLDQLDPELTPSQLANQVAITAYFPRANEVIQAYESKLNDDLTQVEVEELERAFQSELSRGVRGQASLVLTHSDPSFPGQAILEAIPEAWAQYVRDELKTLSTDRIIFSSQVMDERVFEDTDFIAAYGLIRDQINLLKKNLMVLGEEANSGLVRDPVSGRRLADIEAQAEQLESLYLDNLLSQVVGLGLTRNPERTLAFIEARSQALQRQAVLLAQKSAEIDQALKDYSRVESDGTGGVGSSRVGATGDAFLDRLVALGVESGDLAFRQTLTRERLGFDLEATTVRSELARLAVLSDSVASMNSAERQAMADEAELVDAISQAFDEIIRELRAMFDATTGIAEQMDVLQLAGDGSLYRINHVSGEPVALASMFSPATTYWFWVFMVALALGVVALVSMQEMLDIIGKRRRMKRS